MLIGLQLPKQISSKPNKILKYGCKILIVTFCNSRPPASEPARLINDGCILEAFWVDILPKQVRS